jgi:hypothetical protein
MDEVDDGKRHKQVMDGPKDLKSTATDSLKRRNVDRQDDEQQQESRDAAQAAERLESRIGHTIVDVVRNGVTDTRDHNHITDAHVEHDGLVDGDPVVDSSTTHPRTTNQRVSLGNQVSTTSAPGQKVAQHRNKDESTVEVQHHAESLGDWNRSTDTR